MNVARASRAGSVSSAAAGAGTAAAGADPVNVAVTRLLRIQEVAAEIGLTPRSIRYYEELGLLTPAARSEGDYRLYDDSDLERLRFIKGLRDDAGFSLAEIAQLLEDEAARVRARERFRSGDPTERRDAILDTVDRIERQIATLRAKAERIQRMTAEAEQRLAHVRGHLAELDAAGPDPVDAEGGGTAAPEPLR